MTQTAKQKKDMEAAARAYAEAIGGEVPLTPPVLDENDNVVFTSFHALVGDYQTAETAYGLLRRTGSTIERWDGRNKEWMEKPDLYRFFNGDNNDAEEITEAQAKKLMDTLTI